MATDLAPVTPTVLAWARHGVGASIEDAAKRASVPPERLASWEAGEAEPTVAKLRSLADFYLQPLAVFFLPEPPASLEPFRDFRNRFRRGLGSCDAQGLSPCLIQQDSLRATGTRGGVAACRLPAIRLADGTEAAQLGRPSASRWLISPGIVPCSRAAPPLERMRGSLRGRAGTARHPHPGRGGRRAVDHRAHQLVAVELRAATPQHRPPATTPTRPTRPRDRVAAHRQTHRLAKPLEPPMTAYPRTLLAKVTFL